MDKKKTGNLIREARNRKNYTQGELGNLIGVSNKAVSRWENGESFPDVGVLENLASVLDIKIQDIITGETGTADDNVVAEVVRVAKLQQKEKTHKLFKNILLIIAILCCVVSGISSIGNKVILDSFIAYLAMMIFSFAMILVIYAKQTVCETKGTGRFPIISKIIAVATSSWTVLLTWSVFLMVNNGYYPLHMELASIGPFVNYQLAVIHVVNILLIAVQIYRIDKYEESIHWGWFVEVAAIYLASVYGDLLHRISSEQEIVEYLAIRTIAVLLVMGISLATMIVVRLLSKRKHKYKDERSMDRS